MQRRILLAIFLCLPFLYSSAQLNNNWIHYDQPYYKFKVANTGMYRIRPAVLQQAGINLSNIHPRQFHIMGRGREIPIYVANENNADSIFNGSDYIEFFAERNSAWADSLVTENTGRPLNRYTSLFSDTICYYLTWDNSSPHLRYLTESDTVSVGVAPADYYLAETINNYNSSYANGKANSAESFSPEFEEVEGYSTNYIYNLTTPAQPAIGTSNVFSSGPAAQCSISVMSNTDHASSGIDNGVRLHLGTLSGTVLLEEQWDGAQAKHLGFSIPTNALSSPQTSFALRVISTAGNNAKTIGISSVSCIYPHTITMEAQAAATMMIQDHPSLNKQVYRLGNFSPGNDTVMLYNLSQNKRYLTRKTGNQFLLVVPNTGIIKRCFIFNTSSVRQVNQLEACGTNGFFTNYFVAAPDADLLLVTHKSLLSAALAYTTYKNAKGFNTLLATIDELYDQYAFGILKNPLAIRGFAAHALQALTEPPKGLFLIGKSILSLNARTQPNWNLNLIPTWGYYGSDELITANIGGAVGYAPQIPVGRLAANTLTHVNDYLAKVTEFENQPKSQWMKEILHFSGGTTQGEQQQHRIFLDNYKRILEDTLFGGRVTTYAKSTTAPIEIAAGDSIRKRIESGVSIMNFFGHAAGSGFDVSPEPPDQYNTDGKYSLVMANSCYVGDLHQPPDATYQFVSEKYILTPSKGAIAFIAQSSPGLGPPGYFYTRAFYENLGQKKYGASIGACIKAAIEDVQNPQDEVLKETCLTMTLHGDPTLSVNPFSAPDYEITNASVSLSPEVITTAQDSFRVKVVIKNPGQARNMPVLVTVKRFLPDSVTPRVYTRTIPHVFFSEEVNFTIPVYITLAPGANQLEIQIDPLNQISEINEQNNRVNLTFDVKSDEIYPVYPYRYGLVDTNAIFLKASTGDLLAPERTYVFEIDTLPGFNSAFKRRTSITKSGGVIQWGLPFLLSDSIVYYWRISPDSLPGAGYKWKQSSFQYIRKRKGWEQAHHGQLRDNLLSLINYNQQQQKFTFDTLRKTLTCYTWSAPSGSIPPDADLFATEYRIDQKLIESAGISYSPSLHVAVMDSATLEPWEIRYLSNGVMLNPSRNFGNANDNLPINGHTRYFIFNPANVAQMNGLKNMLLNGIPNGNYVLIYTWINGRFQAWPDTSLFTVLENMGADSVRFLPNHKAWAFFARKGNPSSAIEAFSPGNGRSRVSLTASMQAIVNRGSIYSPLIGPAIAWDSVSWNSRVSEIPQTDSASFELYGIRYNGQKDTLNRTGLFSGSFSLTGISAQVYPYMQMRYFTKDAVNRTPAQLRRWHLFYKPAPECAINPNALLELSNKSVQQGEKLTFKTLIKNISDQPMDSLLVKFWLEDAGKQISPLSFPKSDSLRAGFSQTPMVSIDTKNLLGKYKLWIDANPFIQELNKFDQPEQYRFNNTMYVDFQVSGDKTNPLLDVTFNGQRIMDGELVSPKPEIRITLKDENKFLALNDTSAFSVYLLYPGESAARKIHFQTAGGAQMRFQPASLPNNSCAIDFAPSLSTDGIYTLQVQAKDASGNLSGKNEYSIRFEVVNKSSITRVMNYPNPFSTSTRFVFTLTGLEIPTWLKIQILTVSGKVVREITLDELGPLRIGKNISSYAWDGTDTFGDKLANGLYLYKVFCNINGEEIEHRESGADAYFTKEFGKMILLR
jgi:hypothetical protein